MSCDDIRDEINLELDVNPDKNTCTVCSLNTQDNIWFVPRAPGFPGRCILDELTYADVYWVLMKNPKAAEDLKKITEDPTLLKLANEVKLVEYPMKDSDEVQKRLNANSIPFYTVLRGNSDGTIR